MKYSKEQRDSIARKAIKEKNIAKIASEYRLNKSTIYRYIEKLSDNDNRKNHLSISFTDKEYYKFVSRAKELGYEKNYAYYIRKMLFDKNRVMVNPSKLIDELYSLRAELNKIGSNLNQVANYTNILIKNNIIEDSYKKELEEIHLNFEIKVYELKSTIDKTLQKV